MPADKPLGAGDLAPEFDLERFGGGRERLSRLLEKSPVVLVFFKISCPVCQYTFPFLERLHRHAAAGTPRLVGVSQDDQEGTFEFHQECGVTFETLIDGAGYPASNAYGLTHVPTLFLVQPGGQIAWTSTGFHKGDLEELGRRMGHPTFTPEENVPSWKAG